MSIVVVVRKDNTAVIAADTLYSAGSSKVPAFVSEGRSKLVAVPTGWLGLVGSSVHPLVWRRLVKTQPERLRFGNTDEVFNTLLELQDDLEETFRYRSDEDGDEQPFDSNQTNGLLCTEAGLFHIDSYREVFEVSRYWAIGSGDEFALGALHALYDRVDDPEELARIAVTTACTFDNSCELPMHVQRVVLKPG